MKMKRLFSLLVVCALCFGAVFSVGAAETDRYDRYFEGFERLSAESPDYPEIAALEDEMLDRLRTSTSLPGKIPDDFKPLYTEAYKVYTDTQILSMNTANEEEIRAALEKGDYYWMLPFPDCNGYTRKACVLKNGGQWSVSYVEEYESDPEVSYLVPAAKRMARLPQWDYSAVLVGGLNYIRQPVAVVFQEGEARYLVESQYPLPLEGSDQQKQKLLAPGFSLEDGVYDYKKVSQTVRNAPVPSPDLLTLPALNAGYLDGEPASTAWEFSPAWLSIVIVAVVGIAAAILIMARKGRRNP